MLFLPKSLIKTFRTPTTQRPSILIFAKTYSPEKGLFGLVFENGIFKMVNKDDIFIQNFWSHGVPDYFKRDYVRAFNTARAVDPLLNCEARQTCGRVVIVCEKTHDRGIDGVRVRNFHERN